MGTLIAARALTKLYGVVIGVNDVTLDLKPGVIGLLGPNGAGKSTFLKLITGQLRPTEGTLEVLGERPWANIGLLGRLGYCPEHDGFYERLTALEFVTALGRLSGLGAAAREKAAAALERVNATEFMHRPIGEYSRGMRQRTKIAQALAHDPPLLILDEPLAGTDPIGRREIIDLIVGLGKEGRSLLISSHVLHEVQAMTDEFVLMHGGRVLASGQVQEIRSLMNEFPHRITIRCSEHDEGQRLAHHVMRDLPVQGVELAADGRDLAVLTRDPGAFYQGLPEVVLGAGVRVEGLGSADDSLEAVFSYLIGGN